MSATPLKVLLAYGGLATPLATLYFPVYIFLADFYVKNFNIELEEVAIIFLFVRLFDALSDPIIGIISDRFKTIFGFRHFWILLGIPIIMLAALALFWPDSDANIESKYLFMWLFLLTIGWTIVMTPYLALGAEISPIYTDRSRITLYREAAALSGTVVAAILYSLGKNDFEGMRYIAVFLMVTLPLTSLCCVYFVKEKTNPKLTPKKLNIKQLFLVFKSEPMFLRLLLAYFVNGSANALPAALFVFFVNQILGAPHLAGPFLLLYFGSAILATPVWIKLSTKVEKHRLWCYTMIYACGVFSTVALISSGDLIGFFLICLFGGAALSADLAIPSSIQADLIDLDILRAGKRRTATFFAFWSIATKGSVALSSGLALLILSFFDFDVTGRNSEKALLVLICLYGFIPIILKISSIVLMWNFKLTKSYHEEIREALNKNSH